MDKVPAPLWIPVWKTAQRLGKNRQDIYRWIRESKIPKEFVQKKTVEVERIFIREDFKIG